MTRTEAFEALEKGERISHKRWNKDDYAQILCEGYLQFEDGSQCSLTIFKRVYGDNWDDDNWMIIPKTKRYEKNKR